MWTPSGNANPINVNPSSECKPHQLMPSWTLLSPYGRCEPHSHVSSRGFHEAMPHPIHFNFKLKNKELHFHSPWPTEDCVIFGETGEVSVELSDVLERRRFRGRSKHSIWICSVESSIAVVITSGGSIYRPQLDRLILIRVSVSIVVRPGTGQMLKQDRLQHQ